MCVKLTLPPRPRARWLLITIRLSTINLAGTALTEVAVGISKLASILVTTRAEVPLSFSTTSSTCATGAGLAAGAGWLGALGTLGVLGVADVAGVVDAGAGFCELAAGAGALTLGCKTDLLAAANGEKSLGE